MSTRRWLATVGMASLLVLMAGCGEAAEPPGTAIPTVTATDLPTASNPSSSSNPPDATPGPVPTTKPTTKPTDGGPVVDGGPVTVTGVPEPGVEAGCLLLDGYLLLGGDRALLGQGVPVTVTGHLGRQLASFCQQGRPLVVDTVKASG